MITEILTGYNDREHRQHKHVQQLIANRLQIREKLFPIYRMVMQGITANLIVSDTTTAYAEEQPRQEWDIKAEMERDETLRHGSKTLENGFEECLDCGIVWDGDAQHLCPDTAEY